MPTEQSSAEKELDSIKLKEQILAEADKKYAIKIVERIVFGLLGLFGIAIAMKLISLVGL